MNTPNPDPLERQRELRERSRRELEKLEARGGLPEAHRLGLPDEEDLINRLPRPEGQGAGGAISRFIEYDHTLDDVQIIWSADNIYDPKSSTRLVCIVASGFNSLGGVIQWLENSESMIAARPVPPQLWVVVHDELNWRQLGQLKQTSATYKEIPPNLADDKSIQEWIAQQYATSCNRDHASPRSRQSSLHVVGNTTAEHTEDDTSGSSVDSWIQDQRESTHSHVRGITEKQSILSSELTMPPK